MNIENFLRGITNNSKLIIIISLVGIVLSLAAYTIPLKFTAVGTVVIYRQPDKENEQFFSYEGYYAQQTALSYTNSAISILESTNLLKKALEDLGIEGTYQNLKKAEKSIVVKKTGPQVITIEVSHQEELLAKNLWKSLTNNFLTWNQNPKNQIDNKIKAVLISSEPVIKKPTKYLVLYLTVGAVTGALAAIAYIFIKEHTTYES